MPEAKVMKLWVQSGTKMGDKECEVMKQKIGNRKGLHADAWGKSYEAVSAEWHKDGR